MKTIEEEWKSLSSKLTKEQLKDGKRIFTCGALLLLADYLSGDLTLKALKKREKEIKEILEL